MKNPPPFATGNRINSDTLKLVASFGLFVLAVLAAISVAKGFQNALIGSQDFQWSPARLLGEGINPYQIYLGGNKDGALILSQGPNYLHLLYILFLPFGLLDWDTVKPVWAVTNVALGILCVHFIARTGSKISGSWLLAVLLVFLCSTPFRTTVSNGQHGLLILLCSYLGWSMRPTLRSSPLLSISYVKYSFAPPVMLWLLLEKNFRLLFMSFLFLAAGWILFSILAGINPLQTALQPLQVSALAVSEGTADVMSIVRVFDLNRHVFPGVGYVMGIGLAIGLTLYLRFFCKHLADEDLFAALGLISLMSFIHLGYDFVFLLPVLCRAHFLGLRRRVLVYAGVGYFWFALRFFMTNGGHYSWLILLNFLVIAGMFFVFVSSRHAGAVSGGAAGFGERFFRKA